MKKYSSLHKKLNGVFENRQEHLIHEVKLLYKLLPTTRWIDVSVVVIIAGLLIKYIDFNQLVAWCLTIFIIMSTRACICDRFKSTSLDENNVQKWFDLFLVGATLYGAMWSFTAIILVPSDIPVAAGITALVLCALTTIVAAVSSINISVFATYIVTTIWPYAFFLISINTYPQSTIGIAAVFVSLVILLMGNKINKFYNGMIDLELKNIELYKELQYESKRLELVENSLLNNILDEELAVKIRQQSLEYKQHADRNGIVHNTIDNSLNSYIRMLDSKIKSQLNNCLYFVSELEQGNLSEAVSKNVKIINKVLTNIVTTIDKASIDEERMNEKLSDLICQDYEHSQINIRRMINYITHEIPLSQKVKSIRIDKHIDKVTPTNIYGPKDALNEILFNLVNNAVKYNNGGNVNVSVDTLDMDNNHLILQFTVADTGVGMDSEIMEFLKNGDLTISEKYPGLTVVKNLVSKYAKNFIVDSTPVGGTNIMFQMAFDTNYAVAN